MKKSNQRRLKSSIELVGQDEQITDNGERDRDLALNIEDVIEFQVIEITAKPRNIIIGIIYRPPNNKLQEFKKCLARLLQKID